MRKVCRYTPAISIEFIYLKPLEHLTHLSSEPYVVLLQKEKLDPNDKFHFSIPPTMFRSPPGLEMKPFTEWNAHYM